MKDPYEILGVSRNASMDEIKKAYRDLSRKYHPDANINNPLADLAAEKFKEVQQAYDTIVKERERGTSYGYGSSTSGSSYGYGYSGSAGSSAYTGSNDYSMVYTYLRGQRYHEALNLLSGMPKDAHWYYLSAFAHAGCGNSWQALTHAQQAVNMEPSNPEYRNLLNQLQSYSRGYNTMGGNYGRQGTNGDDCCDLCCTLFLFDSCCECMGGDICACM